MTLSDINRTQVHWLPQNNKFEGMCECLPRSCRNTKISSTIRLPHFVHPSPTIVLISTKNESRFIINSDTHIKTLEKKTTRERVKISTLFLVVCQERIDSEWCEIYQVTMNITSDCILLSSWGPAFRSRKEIPAAWRESASKITSDNFINLYDFCPESIQYKKESEMSERENDTSFDFCTFLFFLCLRRTEGWIVEEQYRDDSDHLWDKYEWLEFAKNWHLPERVGNNLE